MRHLISGLCVLTAMAVFGSAANAGRVPSPRVFIERVAGHGTLSYLETFQRGAVAMVDLADDGSSALELYVYDDKGTLVAHTTGTPAIWIPAQTGVFRIEVRNLGCCTNLVRLRTN